MAPATSGVIAVFIIAANAMVIFGCARKEQTQEEVARLAEEKTPKLYSKANGCEVYRFAVFDRNGNIDRYAYFAKCDGKQVRVDDSIEKCRNKPAGKTTQRVCETIDNSVGVGVENMEQTK